MKNSALTTAIAATLTTSVVAVAIYIGYFNPQTKFPDPIEVDGQKIEFTWTDNNDDENLHIYTDRATYTNGISSADMYVAVVNQSSETQEISLMGFFRDSSKRVEDIKVLTQVTESKPETELQEVCVTNATTTKTNCSMQEVVVAQNEVTRNMWANIPLEQRTEADEATELAIIDLDRKPVENFNATEKSVPVEIAPQEVAYFRVLVHFPPNSSDNFYLETIGNNGGYGHLDPWVSGSWTKRIKLEINPNQVAGTTNHVNFPVYVNLNNLPADFHTNVKTDGCDIRVVESDETTETPFELVSYDSATDSGELHFKADSLSPRDTTTFYIYYGNSGASCYAATDTYGRNNVWTEYAGVWHMQETSASNRVSSTGNNTLTQVNTPTQENGKIGKSIKFSSASTQYLTIADASQTGLDITGNMTITAWYKTTTTANEGHCIVCKWNHSNQNQYQTLINPGSGTFTWGADDACSGFTYSFGSYIIGTLSTSNWYYAGFTRETLNGTIALAGQNKYVNTIQTSTNCSAGFAIGMELERALYKANAEMDEIRIAPVLRSEAWLLTEYNNQNSPSTFYYATVENQATLQPRGVILNGGKTTVNGGRQHINN